MVVRKALLCKWLLLLLILCNGFISKAQLAANFSATPTTGCAPLLVNFTDLSTGSPTSWKWDLGNGTISYLKNPAVTYFSPGQYNVKLIVTNAGGTDEVVKSQFITVYSVPSVNFTGSPLSGCFPLPVQFTDQSSAGSGSISTREWDFGDGNLSGTQDPSHIYTGPGNFNVSLRITNSYGCFTTVTKTQYVKIASGVTANFIHSNPSSCTLPATINFTGTSTGSGVLNYQWDFGDGATSASQNPSHTYTANGSYTIKLIVTNSTGCSDTLIKTNGITIGNAKADFSVPSTVCAGSNINIVNSSIPAPASAAWNFGDGTISNIISPTKAFITPGNYTIKMVANFGACADSVSKTVSVLPALAINFSADKTYSCAAPLSVNFTGSVTAASSYYWNFGDGTTSSSQNPSHIYTSPGVYDVKLVATNSAGCKDSIIKSAYIKIQPPGVNIPNLPAKDCAPFNFSFTANVNSADPISSYNWDFGDGGTSSLANPSHTFTNAGSYTIKVFIKTAGGCTDSAIVADGILVGTKLKPDLTADPRKVCAFMPVNFSDLTTGGKPDKWLWLFGDGSSSTQQNPTHVYNDTGYFNVTLIVWDRGCADTIIYPKYIHIKPPVAIFTFNNDCSKTRVFTDHSIGADTWFWEFGDGATSTQQNPVHTYADTGSYNVKLTVTNAETGCSYSQYLLARILKTKADFTASDTAICKGSPVTFQTKNVINNDITYYYWDFGDGQTFIGAPNISHTYLNAGRYSVKLIITDIFGCTDSILKTLYIRVGGPAASFKSSVPGVCLNTPVTFTDNSKSDGVSPIQQWVWNYGDGVTETLSAPPFQHTYSAQGNFIVSLKVIDSKGCADSTTLANSLMISKPVAAFTTLDTMSCHTQQVTFTNLSTGPNLTYKWNFGDGTTSTASNPSHIFSTEGSYTISLSVTDQFGCTDNVTKANYVTIADPKASFTLSDSVSTCPPLVITFTNHSTGFTSRSWDFGDGTTSSLDNPTHFYSTPGIFNVVLTVKGNNGCTDQATKKVIVKGPQGSFTYSNIFGCNPLKTDFKGSTKDKVSFIWDFNDGTTLSTTDSIVSHTYINIGTYLPKMILVDPGGCQVPIIGSDTIRVFGVNANFKTVTTTLCDSGYATYKDLSFSNDNIVSYLWNFGDGSTSSLQNPVHSYNSTGTYNTTLKITTQAGCTDTVSNASPIKIVSSPRISIVSNDGACVPAVISFSGKISTPDTSAISWKWNFGNGKTSASQDPAAQRYLLAGKYTVSAIATNSSGCKDSVSKVVEAYPLPDLKATVGTWMCKGQTINLSASGAAKYNWSPANGLSCINCAAPVAKPDSSTKYIVQGTSSYGCIATDSVMLSVRTPFKMEVSKGDTICKGNSRVISAKGANTYVWSPSAGLSNATTASPTVTPAVTTNYMVIGSDDKGCFKDTGYVAMRVFPIPTVEAGTDKTINVGQTLDLDATTSSDVTNVIWTPTSGIFRNRYPGITIKPVETTEFTVEVTNAGGCRARDKVTIFVLCNNANVFIPNTFSPNGDGANDVFYPRGTGIFTIKNFRIFNRWGEVVYEKANFQANDASVGWDGTFKGNKLNPDVFVYTIDIVCENNTILTYKGNIALIR